MLHHGALLSDRRFTCIDYAGDLVATGDARGSISFYRIVAKTTRLRPELTLQVIPPADDKLLHVPLTCIRFSPCCQYLSAGTALGCVLVFDLSVTNRLEIKCQHEELHQHKAISALCWSPESTRLFSGCAGGSVVELLFSDPVIPSSSSSAGYGSNADSSATQLAFSFASALQSMIMKRPTQLICQCEEIIRQLECTFTEACSCGLADVLAVFVSHHSLIFQLPKVKHIKPRFCDIPVKRKLPTADRRDRQGVGSENNQTMEKKHVEDMEDDEDNDDELKDELWCAGCFCNSYVTNDEYGRHASVATGGLVRATGLFIAQQCQIDNDDGDDMDDSNQERFNNPSSSSNSSSRPLRTEKNRSRLGVELLYCAIDGQVQQSFKLSGPFRQRVDDHRRDVSHDNIDENEVQSAGTDNNVGSLVRRDDDDDDDGDDENVGRFAIRCLRSFSSSSHKHLLVAVTADNSVLLINLQEMSCDYLLPQFDFTVHAAVPVFVPGNSAGD